MFINTLGSFINIIVGSKTGKIQSITITGCEETNICEFKRGETYNVDMSFQSRKYAFLVKLISKTNYAVLLHTL